LPKSSESGLAVECRGVAKRFHHYEHRTRTLQEFILGALRREQRRPQGYFELQSFDLEIEHGDSVALIGANGSGKSTILRLIAGIYPPSEGHIRRNGRVVSVIELGSTFQPALTGDENVELYAAALGLRRREIAGRREQIFAFSGVGEFRDVPLKYYSSGMRSRLAFAIAANAEPDILLLDEVLAVGDQDFRSKCYERLQRFNADGGTLIVVTHDLEAARTLCRLGVWVDHGRIVRSAAIGELIEAYEAGQS
jgi:homopolymeric O-antigen transport system ATP-binding protein